MKLFWGYRLKMLGRLLMEIDCRGCMAEDHQLVRVGEIVEVDDQRKVLGHETGEALVIAKCRVIQSRTDLPEEFFTTCPIIDGDFQELPRGKYRQHLGYIWRH